MSSSFFCCSTVLKSQWISGRKPPLLLSDIALAIVVDCRRVSLLSELPKNWKSPKNTLFSLNEIVQFQQSGWLLRKPRSAGGSQTMSSKKYWSMGMSWRARNGRKWPSTCQDQDFSLSMTSWSFWVSKNRTLSAIWRATRRIYNKSVELWCQHQQSANGSRPNSRSRGLYVLQMSSQGTNLGHQTFNNMNNILHLSTT